MSLFSYKGKRLQLYYKYLNLWYTFLFSLPSFAMVIWLCWSKQTEIISFVNGNQRYIQQIVIAGMLGLSLLLSNVFVSMSLIKQSRLKGGYFSRLQRCQWLLKYLIENNLVDIKRKKRRKDHKNYFKHLVFIIEEKIL